MLGSTTNQLETAARLDKLQLDWLEAALPR